MNTNTINNIENEIHTLKKLVKISLWTWLVWIIPNIFIPFLSKLWLILMILFIINVLFTLYLIASIFLTKLKLRLVKNNIEDQYLSLIAQIIKNSPLETPEKKDYVYRLLYNNFGAEFLEKNKEKLNNKIQSNIDLIKACKNLSYISYQERKQLIFILFAIATCTDKYNLIDNQTLMEIGVLLHIRPKSFLKIKNIFVEPEISTETNQNESTCPKIIQKNDLKNAYQMLGLDESASFTDVKLAYHALAKIHHPDIVEHLGAEISNQSAEIFKKVKSAYDTILYSKSEQNQ